jgi:proteic killer suppression protein
MIKLFEHKGLEAFFLTGNMAGIRPQHADHLRRVLSRLDVATTVRDMNLAGLRLHSLSGSWSGHYSVKVNGSWRLTFRFEGGDAIPVDYRDVH